MYEQLITDAINSQDKNKTLLSVIEKVCYDNGLDQDSTWALLEIFNQK